ncbi:MAG TPA: methyltransferase domain-containing protein [Solirubrobacterales bacterium]|nr:methyltransferase domain-containing protein [Solirubrobacterales bacterium]
MPVDLDEYRRSSHETWERIAANWDEERTFIHSATAPVNERMIERLDPQPGETVLDLAAGTGDTGFLAAAVIGDEGRLISTDFASAMVDAARGISAQLGLGNVEHRVLDAERMDLDDSSVDRVLCRFGYMLMADPAAALAETRRVLRDGGRLVFGVWTAPGENQWAFVPGLVLVERGHMPPPEPEAPGIFGMADPERIRALVTGAGFADPEIEQVDMAWPYADADEHWSLTRRLAGPLADAVDQLDEEERETVRADVRSRIEPLLADGPAPGRVHVVTTA